jgi:hypothetical protein
MLLCGIGISSLSHRGGSFSVFRDDNMTIWKDHMQRVHDQGGEVP